MANHKFKETTVVGDKVYFKGEADLSEKEVAALNTPAEFPPDEKAKQETSEKKSK